MTTANPVVKGDLSTKVAGSKVSLYRLWPMSLGLPMWIKTLLLRPLGGLVSIGSRLCGDGPFQGPGECFLGGSGFFSEDAFVGT
jgi:hypothetical protein